MIAAALLLSLLAQDTVPSLPARARAMLATFPTPREGEVMVTTRFSTDSAWIGQQVELLTAAWFPEELRARLRRSPTLTAPPLSGLWSVQSQILPVLAGTRRVGRQNYAVYVQYQILFPLTAGRVEVPAAELGYSVPTSSSFFAPEDRKSVASRPVHLIVRPLPAALVGAVGSGPTASGLRVTWFGPATPMRVGVPALLELAIAGTGNLALWPAPDIAWPAGLRVYPEQTTESYHTANGIVAGEKRFRFTVVVDSAGIYTLPRVRYPYFDPATVTANAAEATPFPLPVLPAARGAPRPDPPMVGDAPGTPLSATLVRQGWPALLLLAVFPLLVVAWRRRRRREAVPAPAARDPERELRALLREPADAGPERVAAALRHRGVPRADAEQLHRWLVAIARRRYGPVTGEAPAPPAIVADVLRRLRGHGIGVLLLLLLVHRVDGQANAAAERFRGGDYPGAEQRYAAIVEAQPAAAAAWRDLGSSRWMQGDDAGAATAWLHAFALSPRDRLLHEVWDRDTSIPAEVRALAPVIPLSRDELWLLALAVWLAAWVLLATHRVRLGQGFAAAALLVGALATLRWYQESRPLALLRESAAYRVSPIPTAPELGSVAGWSLVEIAAHRGGWVLAVMPDGHRGWLPASEVAPLAPLD